MIVEKEVEISDARLLLNEGDILLFRGKGFWSSVIKRASEGRHSHVGIVSGLGSNGSTIWECVEFKENKGGRSVNLKTYVDLYKGKIDVYRASPFKKVFYYNEYEGEVQEKVIGVNFKQVTNNMRHMTGLPYGWKRLLWLSQKKIPFLRMFYSIDSVTNDKNKDLIYPVCSTAIAYSFGKEGYDLVHNRADESTEPSDIARSPLLSYLFTLTP